MLNLSPPCTGGGLWADQSEDRPSVVQIAKFYSPPRIVRMRLHDVSRMLCSPKIFNAADSEIRAGPVTQAPLQADRKYVICHDGASASYS